MTGRSFSGTPASPGVAIGRAWRLGDAARRGAVADDRPRERDTAIGALAQAAQALRAIAARMQPEEAEIVEAGVLMAEDPALARAVEQAVLGDGLIAADAILWATAQHAEAIAALGDETLAARADDVRSLGRRAALLAGGSPPEQPPGTDQVLLAHDLGPADVAELAPALAGIALAAGGATSHAAIVARSLGVPLVAGLGTEALELDDGAVLVLDGGAGVLMIDPDPMQVRAAEAAMHGRRRAREREAAEREMPAVSSDGRHVTVLANVASRAELDVALSAGAEGIGLLRTELAFLDAREWPDEQEHTEALEPILSGLGGRRAVVRVLDFSPDKPPPLVDRAPRYGLELLLDRPERLVHQLRALLSCARGRDVRVLLPMVDRLEQLLACRDLLEQVRRELDIDRAPLLGAMIETPLAVANASAIAGRSDFLSIGTNDLTAAALGADRLAAGVAAAHHPCVLRLIADTVRAAHDARITVEICGEAGSDPLVLPLLVGLGVDEISVGAARVGTVRRWVRLLNAGHAEELARSALQMSGPTDVERSVGSLAAELEADRGPAGSATPGAGGSSEHGNGSDRVEHGPVHALGG